MIPVKSFAAQTAAATLAPFNFERRDPGPHDVSIEIMYCGVCHTDIHFVNNDWGISVYPMVPGHEGGLSVPPDGAACFLALRAKSVES